jgi:hypothetical protein
VTFAAKAGGGSTTELEIHERHEAVPRAIVATVPLKQEPGYIVFGATHSVGERPSWGRRRRVSTRPVVGATVAAEDYGNVDAPGTEQIGSAWGRPIRILTPHPVRGGHGEVLSTALLDL